MKQNTPLCVHSCRDEAPREATSTRNTNCRNHRCVRGAQYALKGARQGFGRGREADDGGVALRGLDRRGGGAKGGGDRSCWTRQASRGGAALGGTGPHARPGCAGCQGGLARTIAVLGGIQVPCRHHVFAAGGGVDLPWTRSFCWLGRVRLASFELRARHGARLMLIADVSGRIQ